jgi:hypothetical protein
VEGVGDGARDMVADTDEKLNFKLAHGVISAACSFRITQSPSSPRHFIPLVHSMDASQRVASAASFILQSPPGEINDIISDLRTIVDDDEALQTGIQPALEEYNKEQFVCVTAPGKDHQV